MAEFRGHNTSEKKPVPEKKPCPRKKTILVDRQGATPPAEDGGLNHVHLRFGIVTHVRLLSPDPTRERQNYKSFSAISLV
jgi:hypothetical protein